MEQNSMKSNRLPVNNVNRLDKLATTTQHRFGSQNLENYTQNMSIRMRLSAFQDVYKRQQCIQDVLDGTAKENHSGYPVVVRNQSGTPFLPSQLLERYLSKLPLKGFPYEEAVVFCEMCIRDRL